MAIYRDHIIHFKDVHYRFPKRFENEIFYSDIRGSGSRPLEYISNFTLKYIIRGDGRYVVNGRTLEVPGGRMLIINDHSEVISKVGDGEAISVFLSKDVLAECWHYRNRNPDQLLEGPTDLPKMEISFYDEVLRNKIPMLEKLKTCFLRDPNLRLSESFYFELADQLLSIQERTSALIHRIEKVKTSVKKEIYKRVSTGRDYMHDHLDKPFDLEKTARFSCMSRFHFIRSFKQVYGSTPNQYFIQKKLEKASNLLQADKQCEILEIALQLGYSDTASFSKQFKRFYGQSPSVFRKQGFPEK